MDSLHCQLEYIGHKREWPYCECIHPAFGRRLRIDTKPRKRRLRIVPTILRGISPAEAPGSAEEEVEMAIGGRRKL